MNPVYKITNNNESSVIGLAGISYNKIYTIEIVINLLSKYQSEYVSTQHKMITELFNMKLSKITNIYFTD